MEIKILSKKHKFLVFYDEIFQFKILAFSFLKTEIIFYIKAWVKKEIKLKSEDEVYLNNKKL